MMRLQSRTSQLGFTLLEILVAASIFAIMSVIAITGIKSILDAQEQTNKMAGQVRALQNTFYYIEQDFRHAIDRDIRDEFGDSQAALLSGNTGLPGLSLTRAGRRNPQGLLRSSLMRVNYRLDEGTVIRSRFANVDRGAEAKTFDRELIGDIEELEFRFLAEDNKWVGFWPQVANPLGGAKGLPRAIEVTLRHETMGKIVKVVALPF